MDTIGNVASLRVAAVFGLLLIISSVLGGWVLGSQIKALKLGDRYVTVRGLSERTVKADIAIWNLDFKESGDVLLQVMSKSEADKKITLKFLADAGIASTDLNIGQTRVVDRLANEYGGSSKGPRYIVDQQISVETKNLDAVIAAQQRASTLVEQGVVLVSNMGDNSIQYLFTGLNSIKPDMISDATKSAREAANRFAADSGSKVGTIRTAEQGVFSISGVNGDSVAGENAEGSPGGSRGDDSVMKKIRVVTTVQYYLER